MLLPFYPPFASVRLLIGISLRNSWEKRSMQHPIFSLDLWPANDVPKVYANLFQLAAQIELLQSTVGWAKVRNELRTDLRIDRWVSTLLQVEVAGLGSREEW